MILYYTVCYNCVTSHSKTQWLKKRRFIVSHEMACQLDGFAYLLWARLISAGFALSLQSVSRLDGCWPVQLGLTWVIQRLYLFHVFSLPLVGLVRLVFMQREESRTTRKSTVSGPHSRPAALFPLPHSNKLQDSSECEWENKLNFLIDGAIESHFKDIG